MTITDHTTTSNRITFCIHRNLNKLPADETDKNRQAASCKNGWQTVDMSLQDLRYHLGRGGAIAPLYSDGLRDTQHTLNIQFIALDFDHDCNVSDLQRHPWLSQFIAVLGNTTSHTPTHPRARAVLPLSEPISDEKTFKRYASAVLNQVADLNPDAKATLTFSRFYFGLRPGALLTDGKLLTLADIEALIPSEPVTEALQKPSEGKQEGDRSRKQKYLDRMIQGQCEAVQTALHGERNNTLNAAAFRIGGYLHYPDTLISRGDVERQLMTAALSAGLSETEARLTIKSGLDDGSQERHVIPDRERREGSDTPRQKSSIESSTDDITPAPSHTDFGDMLIDRFDGNVRFFRGAWHRYKNGLWYQVNDKQVNRQIWQLLKSHQHIKKVSVNRHAVTSIGDYMAAELFTPDEEIDQGANYVPLQNGLLNLNTYQMEPHQRDLFLTSQLPFNYDPSATCPTWERFLSEMLVTIPGTHDPELTAMLQEAFGYSLTTDTRLQASFWLYGEAASGKSTVIDVLQRLAGSAFTHIDLGMLDTNQYQLALLPGKRIATCTESPAGSYLADHIFKSLVSGEAMQVRQIRQEPFTFKPQVKLWWAMNQTPTIKDRSQGVYRRMRVIPFNNPLQRHRQDARLIDKLTAELPGIFLWALEGLKRLRAQGDFTQASQSIHAVETIRQENDTEAAFIGECCVTGEKLTAQSGILYAVYKTWCMENGIGAKSSVKLARELQRLGFTKQHTREGKLWSGLAINKQQQPVSKGETNE